MCTSAGASAELIEEQRILLDAALLSLKNAFAQLHGVQGQVVRGALGESRGPVGQEEANNAQ